MEDLAAALDRAEAKEYAIRFKALASAIRIQVVLLAKKAPSYDGWGRSSLLLVEGSRRGVFRTRL